MSKSSNANMWLYRSALGALAFAASAAGCTSEEQCDPDKPGTVCTIVGTGDRGFDGAEVPALEARMDQPQDLKIAPNGELWVIDFNNYLIRAVNAEGTIRTVVGIGLLGDSPPEGETSWPANDSAFNHVCDMAFNDDGDLYLAAWHNSRLKRLNLETLRLENYAGIAERTKYHGDGGPALEAALDLPSSVDFLPNGDLIFMDQANQVIRTINDEGIISRFAGTCVVEYTAPCEPGEEPVACEDNDKSYCGGNVDDCSQPCNPGFSGDGGDRLSMRMGQPYGQAADPTGRLTVAPDGSVYFGDTHNNRIRRIAPDGTVSTVAGNGDDGYSGDGGPATEATLNNPVDVEVAADGTIYFTDVQNSCIRQIDTSGIISTFAGRCSPDKKDREFAGDGKGPLDARFNRPYGIELSPDGKKMYVADSFNNRIRVINFPE